jgi:hypothetical protein
LCVSGGSRSEGGAEEIAFVSRRDDGAFGNRIADQEVHDGHPSERSRNPSACTSEDAFGVSARANLKTLVTKTPMVAIAMKL